MTMSPKVNEPKVATGYLEREAPITQASRDFVCPRTPGRGLPATRSGGWAGGNRAGNRIFPKGNGVGTAFQI